MSALAEFMVMFTANPGLEPNYPPEYKQTKASSAAQAPAQPTQQLTLPTAPAPPTTPQDAVTRENVRKSAPSQHDYPFISTAAPQDTQIELAKHFCAIWCYGYERLMEERSADGMEWAWDAEYSAGDLFSQILYGITGVIQAQ
ncbi:hypothetical protein ONS96_005102 [Cadophora gregata f. sp. sojae]|nr:hypothetical protein ONS96_005102 [Cadophora gregata f. sp. sojae]